MQNCKQYNQSTWRGKAIFDTFCTLLREVASFAFSFFSRIIGWGIIFKLQMLCPQEDK